MHPVQECRDRLAILTLRKATGSPGNIINRRINRETGERPVQTRCCNSRPIYVRASQTTQATGVSPGRRDRRVWDKSEDLPVAAVFRIVSCTYDDSIAYEDLSLAFDIG